MLWCDIYIVHTYSSNVRTSHWDIHTYNCPSLTCKSSRIIFALCMSTSKFMHRHLNTQLFLGTPHLCRNTTPLVPNVPNTLYIYLLAIYCTNIFSLCIILTYNGPNRRSCCSWKLQCPANRGMSLLLVVLGKLSVRLTAFFHSIVIPLTGVVSRSHVWHPYQAVQYVCSKRILIWPGTSRNYAFSLFTEPINSPLFARISASSHISFVNIIPRYLTLTFHFTRWPLTLTL